MIITIKTTISFDNEKEQHEIGRFIKNNDLTEWAKNETTLMSTFTTTKTYYQTRCEE